MEQAQLDAVREEVAAVFDKHGVKDDGAIAVLLLFAAALAKYIDLPQEGFLSTAERAFNSPDITPITQPSLEAAWFEEAAKEHKP
jgi:hypothetical protein